MSSLRARLTLSVALSVAAAGGILVWVVYNDTQVNVRELLDDQMEQVAKVVGSRVSNVPLNPAVSPSHESEDDLIVSVEPAAGQAAGLGIRHGREQDYRTYRASAGDQSIEVAQGLELRREIARHIATAALVPILVLLPLLALLVSMLIRRHLKPLEAAAASIAHRPPLSRSPLPLAGMPSEIRPLIVEINRLLGRLGDALDREQRFVADASHALRTPLQALQLQVDVLDGSPDPREIELRRQQLRAGIRRAVRLANHLLSLAQSEHSPAATSTALDPAVREIVSAYETTAYAANVHLDVESLTGAFVPADTRRLTLVIGNVLDNAIRYSPPGSRVQIRVTSNHRAAIELTDEGPGIPEADLEHAFDRFNRVTRLSGPGGGSGLGLATARSVARQVGGELTLSNRVGRTGLIVRFTLPRVTAAAAPAETA